MADIENLRVRLPQDMKDRWRDLCAERKIEQASAVRALIEFLLELEPEHQLMVLGQLPGRADLARMLLKRMAEKRRR